MHEFALFPKIANTVIPKRAVSISWPFLLGIFIPELLVQLTVCCQWLLVRKKYVAFAALEIVLFVNRMFMITESPFIWGTIITIITCPWGVTWTLMCIVRSVILMHVYEHTWEKFAVTSSSRICTCSILLCSSMDNFESGLKYCCTSKFSLEISFPLLDLILTYLAV